MCSLTITCQKLNWRRRHTTRQNWHYLLYIILEIVVLDLYVSFLTMARKFELISKRTLHAVQCLYYSHSSVETLSSENNSERIHFQVLVKMLWNVFVFQLIGRISSLLKLHQMNSTRFLAKKMETFCFFFWLLSNNKGKTNKAQIFFDSGWSIRTLTNGTCYADTHIHKRLLHLFTKKPLHMLFNVRKRHMHRR